MAKESRSRASIAAHLPAPEDPCPCASGRRFQTCCAAQATAETEAWRQVRETEARLVRRIASHARARWGDGLFAEAVRQFSLGWHSLESLQPALPALDTWLAFSWVPNLEDEDGTSLIARTAHLPAATLGITWLASGAAPISDVDQAFVFTAAASPHSLLLVESVRPGWSLSIRDLLTDRRFRIVEPEIAARAHPGDVLFSAVMTHAGIATLVGPARDTAPAALRIEAANIREAYSDACWMTRADLVEMTEELCGEYREAWDRARDSHRGAGAGGPMRLRWGTGLGLHEIVERLRPLTAACDGEEEIQIELGTGGEPRARLWWYERAESDDPDDGEWIGGLYVEEGRITADVEGPGVATRLIAEVEARLGPAATLLESCPDVPRTIHSRPPLLVAAVG